MANLFRRAGSRIAKFFQSAADPASVAGEVQVYAKDSGGTAKLFMRNSAGVVSEVGAGGASTIIASTTLASPASTISVSGLNGDLHGEYEIEFNYVASGLGAHNLDIRPNGDTAANRQTTTRSDASIATSTTGVVAAYGAVSTAVHHRSTIKCWVKRLGSNQRRFVMDSTITYNSTVISRPESWTTYISEAANLTSFTIGITNIQFATGAELIVRQVVR